MRVRRSERGESAEERARARKWIRYAANRESERASAVSRARSTLALGALISPPGPARADKVVYELSGKRRRRLVLVDSLGESSRGGAADTATLHARGRTTKGTGRDDSVRRRTVHGGVAPSWWHAPSPAAGRTWCRDESTEREEQAERAGSPTSASERGTWTIAPRVGWTSRSAAAAETQPRSAGGQVEIRDLVDSSSADDRLGGTRGGRWDEWRSPIRTMMRAFRGQARSQPFPPRSPPPPLLLELQLAWCPRQAHACLFFLPLP